MTQPSLFQEKRIIKLFDVDSDIKTSPIFVAFVLLRALCKNPMQLSKDRKFNLIQVFNKLKDVNVNVHPKQIFLALLFLKITGLIDFKKPYLVIKKSK